MVVRLPAVPPEALTWRFTRAGGPGGQHVNKTATRVELDCDISMCGFSPSVTTRVIEALGPTVRLSVTETRSQRRNREIALERLHAQLTTAATPPRPRRPTRPRLGAVETRLQDKRQRSERKSRRAWRPDD